MWYLRLDSGIEKKKDTNGKTSDTQIKSEFSYLQCINVNFLVWTKVPLLCGILRPGKVGRMVCRSSLYYATSL